MPFPKAKGNNGWERRRTHYGGEKAWRKRMKELYNKRREKLEANQQPADKNLADEQGGGAPPAVNESADLTTNKTADVPVPPKHVATPEASLPATPEPTADPPTTPSISTTSASSTT